jgi:hypothetical protein
MSPLEDRHPLSEVFLEGSPLLEFIKGVKDVAMATILKRRLNKASILTSFSISKRSELCLFYTLERAKQNKFCLFRKFVRLKRSGANSVYSTYWTNRSEGKSVYSTNLKERSGAKSVGRGVGPRGRGRRRAEW